MSIRSIDEYLIIPDGFPKVRFTNNYPTVSFCIPTKNRERTIAACLSSIRSQIYPNVELIVIDNGSTDRTVEIANQFADEVGICLGPLGAVRQHSIDRSTGEILAIFDDDVIIPHPHWLMGAVAEFELDPKACTVWPILIPPRTAGWVTRCFFELNDAIFEARRNRLTSVFGGGNSLFKRTAIEEIGGFNPEIGFGEDFDLASRLKSAGHRVIFHRDPLIHDTMYSLFEIYRKQKWGAAAVANYGTSLFAQSYKDLLYEQVIIGFNAMLKGLLIEFRPWWFTYPLLLAIKTLTYASGIFNWELSSRRK